MPLILNEDEGKILGKKQVKVPDKLVNKIKQNLNLFGQYKKSKGFKRASSIVDDDYNKRSNKKDKIHNGDKTLSFSDIKKIDHEYKNMSVNDDDVNAKNLGYILPGGNDMKNWAHDTLRKMRTAVKKVPGVPQVPKLEKNPIKPKNISKDIKMGNATVKLTENYDADHIFYDYMEDYDAYYVLNEFFNNNKGQQDWGVLINPEMYIKALRELSRFGKLTNSTFPSKYVYQWMGIIMKNTAILETNTDLAGHSVSFPGNIVAEFAEKIDGITLGDDYSEGGEWLKEKGLYDWMLMPDGSDAWSDFGLSPLWEIIKEYNEELPPEKVLVLVNRALDVAHCRGDLASIFIQGGSKTLTKISEEVKRNKKIIVNENQLLQLKEYHNQQVFNFDDEGHAYFKKNNWEHYVDFLEDIGKPGMLPASDWDESDIQRKVDETKEEIVYDANDIVEEDYIEAFLDLVYETKIYEYHEMEDIFTPEFIEIFNGFEAYREQNNYYDVTETIRKFLDDETNILSDPENLDNYLTYGGNSLFQEKIKVQFTDRFEEYDMLDSMKVNERGLIYIERNIKIPNFNSPDFDYDHHKNYYSYLKKMYYDLGYYFTWGEGYGEAYCGGSFGKNGTSEIKLKCWVDPKDINWYETVYRNCYSLREEREVYISMSGAKIEVFDVTLENGNVNGIRVSGKSLIKTPIIIQY